MNLFRQEIFAICMGIICASEGYGQVDTLILSSFNNPTLKDYNLRKLAIDKSGKLWFTTDKGVISYDGNDIRVFDHREGDSTSLTTNSTGRLYFDDSNNLYIWAVPGQEYLDTKTGKVTPLYIHFRDEDRSKLAFPYPLTQPFIDDDSSIWAGVYGVGFIHYSRKTRETTHYTAQNSVSFKATTVYEIKRSVSEKNILWLATDNGIYRFNKGTTKFQRNFKTTNQKDSSEYDHFILNLDVGKDTIWFTVPQSGIGCYDIKSGYYTIFPNKNELTGKKIDIDINFFQRKSNDEFYISSWDNLPGVFKTSTHTYRFAIKTSENLPAIDLRHFVADKNDHLWCLIFFQLYLARHSQDRLNTFSLTSVPGSNDPNTNFKTIVWSEKTKSYYAAFESAKSMFVFDSNMQLIKTLPIEFEKKQSKEKPVILDIGIDEMGRVWLCGNSLWFYDVKSNRFTSAARLNPGLRFQNKLFQNLLLRKNFMYLQPSSPPCNAIYRVDLKTLTSDSIPLPEKIKSDTSGTYQHGLRKMDVLQVDKNARFAYFCYNRSLFQLDLHTLNSRRILTLTDEEKLLEQIYNMFWYRLDDMDNLWVVTTKNITVYEPLNFRIIKKISLEKGSYGLQLFNIDGKNIMGYLNSNGLSLLDYKNNNQFNLKVSDGLISTVNSGGAGVNGMLFIGAIGYFHFIPLTAVINTDQKRRCYLSNIQVLNTTFKTDSVPEFLHTLTLRHDQNFITLTFSSTEFDHPERLDYRYKMDGVDADWVYVNYLNRTISYNDLRPGNYIFHAAIKNPNGEWSKYDVNLSISIVPAWWQTNWFKILMAFIAGLIIYWIVQQRIKTVRRREYLKGKHEKELLELEAKALRAQMNPHFVFNSLNSIKSLINKNENDLAAGYLTTFSKLIRTLFQNSDKREVSLHEEIETCKLYSRLEGMRFNKKIEFRFDINEGIDLKDIKVPALILQPFIENAIWHGLVPKESGGVITVAVRQTDDGVVCIVDDNGIGRKLSQQYKSEYEATHQSKGIGLTQSRLQLDKILNGREDTIQIIDKTDSEGKPLGTTVNIGFKILQ